MCFHFSIIKYTVFITKKGNSWPKKFYGQSIEMIAKLILEYYQSLMLAWIIIA